MTKIVQLVNSCVECPNRRYYSGGAHECTRVNQVLPESHRQGVIPPECPLPDYPKFTTTAGVTPTPPQT